MALPRPLLLELLLYGSCFICGIITAASVTISQGSFDGKCMLYGSVRLNSSTIDVLSFSSLSLCYFVSAISVCVAVFCFSLTLYWIYIAFVDGEIKREKLWMNVTLGLSGVFLFFLLVTGCILKIGRDRLCDSLLHTVSNITRCEEAQNKSWRSPINASQFYTRLHSAETAVWVNFFFWMIIVVLVLIQRHKGSEIRPGTEDPSAPPSETEPFFNRPGRP
ncbi:transmembrane protein 179B [Danio rerio]|uniref:Transmembrane protein 179B n=1 Tax=Danio rerio TaxID=7955 RepID=T179B_DANRE|nr:transmembrane protein 179B [Danio rerio]Q7T392.2 RecName: Full=Transmembrane protein 179B [Danio rerio]AAH95324.1 Zgc:110591 [Danio rerio]|eukprot:NP_001018325.1 transmembrane protein 179B [Danio rerio]